MSLWLDKKDGLQQGLDLCILEVFSGPNDSVALWVFLAQLGQAGAAGHEEEGQELFPPPCSALAFSQIIGQFVKTGVVPWGCVTG